MSFLMRYPALADTLSMMTESGGDRFRNSTQVEIAIFAAMAHVGRDRVRAAELELSAFDQVSRQGAAGDEDASIEAGVTITPELNEILELCYGFG